MAAICSGALKKPCRCSGCGTRVPKPTLNGHHRSYDKPLDVTWLCAPCHGKEHRKYA